MKKMWEAYQGGQGESSRMRKQDRQRSSHEEQPQAASGIASRRGHGKAIPGVAGTSFHGCFEPVVSPTQSNMAAAGSGAEGREE